MTSSSFSLSRRGLPRAAAGAALLMLGGQVLAQQAPANPYGLQALWAGSDVVARTTLLILAVMSLGSWYVIFTKLAEQWRLGRHARQSAVLWQQPRVAEGIEALLPASPFRHIAQTGLESVDAHAAVEARIDFNDWLALSIQRAVDRVQSRLQDGMAFLATVGSTAPFVGLFGTVWGIYHALTAIGVSGQASIDKVAGPVGESLIMTAIGLGVAVPAVLGYNWLIRRNKTALDDVRAFGSDLHSSLLASPAPAR
jgi:biopolymer transport protein ExbB